MFEKASIPDRHKQDWGQEFIFLLPQAAILPGSDTSSDVVCRCRHYCLKGYPLQVRHKQDWGRGFILLIPQATALPESDAGSGAIKPALSFVIQNRQTSCSMWCPMYKAHC